MARKGKKETEKALSKDERAREEKVIFYNLAVADFQEASGCLEAMKTLEKGLLRTTLVKNAIIAYSRPFLRCNGIHIPKHHLGIKSVVPKAHRTLHEKVLQYRNQILAHTDLEFRDPKLVGYGMMINAPEDYMALGDAMQELVARVWHAVHNMAIEYRRHGG